MSLRLWALIGTGAIIAGLVIAVLWLRGNNAKLAGQVDVVTIERDSAVKANEANEKTIEAFRNQRVDNDAIAAAIASKLNSNRARTEGQRQAIRNAQNDPNVRAWANQPIPSIVRDTIEAPPGH
jgi:hypothetical protein